jgi:TonB family protein
MSGNVSLRLSPAGSRVVLIRAEPGYHLSVSRQPLLSIGVVAVAAVLGCGGRITPQYDLLVDGGFTAPQPIKAVWPTCTGSNPDLRGRIIFDLTFTKDGSVRDVRLTESEVTEAGCDDDAVRAVKQWRFAPPMKDGQPVDARGKTVIAFPFPDTQ